jgi:transcriptional regulator with XRE-family HTH domain
MLCDTHAVSDMGRGIPINAGNVISAMELAGIRKTALAKSLHVSRSQLYKWLCNKGSPNSEHLHHLAKVLNVSVDYVTGKKEIGDQRPAIMAMVRQWFGEPAEHALAILSQLDEQGQKFMLRKMGAWFDAAVAASRIVSIATTKTGDPIWVRKEDADAARRSMGIVSAALRLVDDMAPSGSPEPKTPTPKEPGPPSGRR